MSCPMPKSMLDCRLELLCLGMGFGSSERTNQFSFCFCISDKDCPILPELFLSDFSSLCQTRVVTPSLLNRQFYWFVLSSLFHSYSFSVFALASTLRASNLLLNWVLRIYLIANWLLKKSFLLKPLIIVTQMYFFLEHRWQECIKSYSYLIAFDSPFRDHFQDFFFIFISLADLGKHWRLYWIQWAFINFFLL